MEVLLPRSALAEIHAHARETYPEECCGFLIGTREGDARVIRETRRARNVHPELREVRYTIDSRDVLRVEREFREEVHVVGVYHSHPDHPARPSSFDLQRGVPWYVYVILSLHDGEPGDVTAWFLGEEQRAFKEASLRLV